MKKSIKTIKLNKIYQLGTLFPKGPYHFAKRNGPNEKRNDHFAKRNGPNGKRNGPFTKKSQKTLYKKNNLIYNKRVKLEITIFFYKNILERKRKT